MKQVLLLAVLVMAGCATTQTTRYEKFLTKAEAMEDKKLERHASVGRVCKCLDCFDCAAEHVRHARARI